MLIYNPHTATLNAACTYITIAVKSSFRVLLKFPPEMQYRLENICLQEEMRNEIETMNF